MINIKYKFLINKISICLFFILASHYNKCLSQFYSITRPIDFIYINIEMENAIDSDTLTIVMHDALITTFNLTTNRIFKATKNDLGVFKFAIPVVKLYGFWTIKKKRTFSDIGNNMLLTPITNPLFWEKGDSVNIKIKFQEKNIGYTSKYYASGKGSQKYNVSNALQNFDKMQLKDGVSIQGKTVDFRPRLIYDKNLDILSEKDIAKIKLLNSFKNSISLLSYDILKSTIIFSYQKANIFKILREFYKDSVLNNPGNERNEYLKYCFDFINKQNSSLISKEAQENSPDFLNFKYFQLEALSYLVNNKVSLNWMFENISIIPIRKLRDNLIIKSFLKLRPDGDTNVLFSKARRIIISTESLQILNELEYKTPGNRILDFEFQDSSGKMISLIDLKNKIVLFDFWFTGCGACAIYYKDVLSKVEEIYSKRPDVVFLSIGIDKRKDVWLKSVNSGLYSGENALNVFTNGEGTENEFFKKMNIQKYPTTILLDKNGIIKHFDSMLLYQLRSLDSLINNMLD